MVEEIKGAVNQTPPEKPRDPMDTLEPFINIAGISSRSTSSQHCDSSSHYEQAVGIY
jgi:hypothetical protein